jgi:predicted transcriptional regulator
MSESTFTFRVDDTLKTAFSDVAKQQDRTEAQLLCDLMREYVAKNQHDAEYDAWFRRKVEAGEKAYREGQFVSHEEVEADAAARRAMLHERLNGQQQ